MRGRNRAANFVTEFFEFLIKFHTFWYRSHGRRWAPKKVTIQKLFKKMDFRNWSMKDLRNWPWNPDFGIEIHQYQYRRHTASSKQSSFQFSFRFGKSQYRRIRMVPSLWNNFVGYNAGFRPGSYWYKNLEINFKHNNKISIYVKPLA